MPKSILVEAEELLSGPREDTYGDAVEMHVRIGRAWGALLDTDDIPPALVALMMAALKGLRDTGPRPDRDNLVDGAAYFRIAERSRAAE